ncbi:hypothetical protein G9C85_08145 [Halorubellus sp. JP-L1]|uniref:hypothetical protein n=1 Tax=Halorubellus sp. JP-L1 TaxID=2715753 RepID=UPI001408CDC3|nr:hypothetical protein [Halorubellus sp. JP-L1]NHN41607.1 hypothetical protein [Halorubellus sp. JP-L1]
MQWFVRGCGFVALVGTAVALLGRAVVEPAVVSVASVGVSGWVLVVGGVAAGVEWRRMVGGMGGVAVEGGVSGLGVERRLGVEGGDVVDVLAASVAAGATYVLSVHAGFGPVVASAVVGLVAGVFVSGVDTAAYCGSFVGMASPAVFPSVGGVVAAGVVAGVAFVAAEGSFAGFGGKLGTLALFGCATTGLALGVGSGAAGGVRWGAAVGLVPVGAVAAVVTAALSVRYGLGAVVGSALVGVVAGVVLPVVVADGGGRLAAVAFCASFVGMSTRERLAGAVRVGLTGALCGLVFVVVAPAFVGLGGKLGTTAFVACLAVVGVDRSAVAVVERVGGSA